MRTYYLLTFSLFLLLSACANYQLNYTSEVDNWADTPPPSSPLSYQVYLIGDAGAGNADWTPPAVQALQAMIKDAPEESAVVFLGDNIYPDGLAPKAKQEERLAGEEALNAQIASFADYSGRVFFVAGNHDWQEYGIKGLERQSKYLHKATDKEVKLLPRPGCGDPVEIKLTDKITLLLLDSQWWLANWRGQEEINDGCEAKSRADFAFLLQEAMKGNRRKELLVAMHHPIFSNGPHGGQYTVGEHLFPLRELNKNLYLPLPVIGTGFRFLQATIGSRQDLANSTYRDWRNLLLQQATLSGDVIFAAGHEHSMQYWEREDHYFVVSGAGSKERATRVGNGAKFAYGGYGFSRLDYYQDGQVWVNYYSAAEGGIAELVFRHQVKDAATGVGEEAPPVISPTFTQAKERTAKISQVDFNRSEKGQRFWGEHYRAAYASDLKVRELDLEAEGLTPVKQGGGFQTNSLRLENPETNRQYALRSIDKDASRTVPYPLNTDLILGIVTDNFSASHPLAALAVAPLAEAAGVYHANPEIVYLPSQQSLGIYNDDYAEALYLFEERPDDDLWKDADYFGNPKEVVSTFDMLEKTRADHDHRVDQRWTIRSRLFDLTIGDWDRHDDQWRWARIKRKGQHYYRPIPRDRDQAFANYDGAVFGIARKVNAKSKQWRPYTGDPGPTHWATYNAFLFDQTFLTGLSWSDWQEAVRHLQSTLSDEVIETAFAEAWPELFINREGVAIKQAMRERRNNLMDIARDYYLFLAKEVDVLGTDQKDLFLITRLGNGLTQVQVYDTNKEGEKEGLLYDRTFLTEETKHIHCYGLGDDDIFRVSGDVQYGIKIDLLGGEGEDTFDDTSSSSKAGALVHIHDFKEEDSRILNMRDSKDKRSSQPEKNLFDRRGPEHNYNFNLLLPILGFNPDDKFLIGFSGTYTRHAFQKKPFGSQHHYGVQVSASTGGIKGYYTGNFTNVLGPLDFQFDFSFQTPFYASNFYGLGNETVNFEEERGIDYHRIRQEFISVAPQLAWRPNDNFELLVGPRFRPIEIERTPDRFIETQLDEIDLEVFEDIGILSWETALSYHNVDQLSFPTRGIQFNFQAGYNRQVDGNQFDYGSVDTELALYQQLDRTGKLVFATRAGLQHRFSSDFPFFLGAKLGGLGPTGNLRGFRRDRFTGRTAFYHNTDLRWKAAFWRNKILPMSVGLTGSFDYGKVSIADVESDTIHYSYGGGAFLSPFELFTIHIGGYVGDGENLRWLIGGAFFF